MIKSSMCAASGHWGTDYMPQACVKSVTGTLGTLTRPIRNPPPNKIASKHRRPTISQWLCRDGHACTVCSAQPVPVILTMYHKKINKQTVLFYIYIYISILRL